MNSVCLLLTAVVLAAPPAVRPEGDRPRQQALKQYLSRLSPATQRQWLRTLERRLDQANRLVLSPSEAEAQWARNYALLRQKEVPWQTLLQLLDELDRREKQAIERLARMFLTENRRAFAGQPEILSRRRQEWARAYGAWVTAGRRLEQQNRLITWLRLAIRRCTPGAVEPMPPEPVATPVGRTFLPSHPEFPGQAAPASPILPRAAATAPKSKSPRRITPDRLVLGPLETVGPWAPAARPASAVPKIAEGPLPVDVPQTEATAKIEPIAAPHVESHRATVARPETAAGRTVRETREPPRSVRETHRAPRRVRETHRPTLGSRPADTVRRAQPGRPNDLLAKVSPSLPPLPTYSVPVENGPSSPPSSQIARRWLREMQHPNLASDQSSVPHSAQPADLVRRRLHETRQPDLAQGGLPEAHQADLTRQTLEAALPENLPAPPPAGSPQGPQTQTPDGPPTQPRVRVNLDELTARIAGSNLAFRTLEAELDEQREWDARLLGPLTDRLAALTVRRNDLATFRRLITAGEQSRVGRLEPPRPVISLLAGRIFEARTRAAGDGFLGTPTERRRELGRLEELSRLLAEIAAQQ